jgi:hypothetical protein
MNFSGWKKFTDTGDGLASLFSAACIAAAETSSPTDTRSVGIVFMVMRSETPGLGKGFTIRTPPRRARLNSLQARDLRAP